MPAVARYVRMFRAAAAVFVLLGGSWLWTALLTDYRPDLRPWTLSQGALAVAIGVLLWRRSRIGIVASAVIAAVVALAAVLYVPAVRGPGILALAALALLCGCYAVMALRALRGPAS